MKIDPVKYFLWTSFFTPHCSILMQKQSVLISIIKSNMERKLINFVEFVGNKAKVESQNGCFKETKHVKFSEKTNISKLLIRTRRCAYQGVRNVRFFGRFDVLCFLETPVLRFALLPYYQRNGLSRSDSFSLKSLSLQFPFTYRLQLLSSNGSYLERLKYLNISRILDSK